MSKKHVAHKFLDIWILWMYAYVLYVIFIYSRYLQICILKNEQIALNIYKSINKKR